MFAENSEYLRGFASAATTIARDLGGTVVGDRVDEFEPTVSGATWGLTACRVPASSRSGAGIRVAVLDTGVDTGHPDFAGRQITTRTFVGQPVQDLRGHGTHCIGTACGPKAPSGSRPRYGIAFSSRMFVGKVLTNSGGGTGASVLAGINWAIANKCEVISMSLGSPSPVQAAYTNAGAAALRNGLLIIAAAGNDGMSTGAPANSPTIMSVASLDPNLRPSSFSNSGKIEIAAPGRDVFSSWPRPTRYRTISGTSMATPHVAGCAALWAQSSSTLRGTSLWQRLQASARALPLPASRVGARAPSCRRLESSGSGPHVTPRAGHGASNAQGNPVPGTKKWLVTIDAAADRSIHDVAKELVAKGFVVDDVLEAVGVISGSPGAKSVDRLRKVKGVIDVSPDTSIQLEPPHSKVTW